MPRDEAPSEKVLSAEQSLARLRVVGLLLITLAYTFLVDPDLVRPTVALTLLVFAWTYSLAVVFFQPYRHFAQSGYIVLGLDALFLLSWVYATGGIASPFHLAFYAAVVSVAYRFGARETLAATLLYGAGYLAMLAGAGHLLENLELTVTRLGFLSLTATYAALLTREALAQANARLEMRERMQEARTAEARYRGFVEAAPDAMVITDRDGRIVLVNSEAERVFGYEREELMGRAIATLVPVDLRALADEVRESGSAAAREAQALRRDGSVFPADVRISSVETEGAQLFTSTIRDLTERQRVEAERLTSLERLKELERLRELDTFKTTFINTAAHELGTPLTPIKLQLHLLRTSRGDALTDREKRSLDILERNVNRLHDLVKDVLDVSRLQASRLGIHLKAVDLNRVVLESAESFQEAARQGGVVLDVRLTPNLQIEADANRLTQVLFNLLGNALKFTPEGGHITLETTRLNEFAIVRVQDTGVGLKPEDIDRLFQPFSQVHDPMQKTRSGSGLGLYISKGIVELHGGRIWVESHGPGLGSTFTVSLPFRPPAPVRPAPETPVDTVARRARELI